MFHSPFFLKKKKGRAIGERAIACLRLVRFIRDHWPIDIVAFFRRNLRKRYHCIVVNMFVFLLVFRESMKK